MYRIMLVTSIRENYESLYKYLTITDDEGNVIPYEAANDDELDAKVESMLNDGYAKNDFIIVTVKDYNINADIV